MTTSNEVTRAFIASPRDGSPDVMVKYGTVRYNSEGYPYGWTLLGKVVELQRTPLAEGVWAHPSTFDPPESVPCTPTPAGNYSECEEAQQ